MERVENCRLKVSHLPKYFILQDSVHRGVVKGVRMKRCQGAFPRIVRMGAGGFRPGPLWLLPVSRKEKSFYFSGFPSLYGWNYLIKLIVFTQVYMLVHSTNTNSPKEDHLNSLSRGHFPPVSRTHTSSPGHSGDGASPGSVEKYRIIQDTSQLHWFIMWFHTCALETIGRLLKI